MRRLWEWLQAGILFALGLGDIDHWREIVASIGFFLILIGGTTWKLYPETSPLLAGFGLFLLLIAVLNWWLSRPRPPGRREP